LYVASYRQGRPEHNVSAWRERLAPSSWRPPQKRRIHGKGGSVRTVLLDDRGYVALLKLYLARAGYTAGPLFRASINGRGGPLSYDAAHHRWQSYCAQAGVEIDIHQLRHAHATELINAGVSIEAVRRRLGHASTETTQLYALLDDKVADAEIRAARRRRDRATR
jgi:integrase/recombinase XerD